MCGLMYTKRAIVAIKCREERVVVDRRHRGRRSVALLSIFFAARFVLVLAASYVSNAIFWSWLQQHTNLLLSPTCPLSPTVCVFASFNWKLNGNLTCGTQSELIFPSFVATIQFHATFFSCERAKNASQTKSIRFAFHLNGRGEWATINSSGTGHVCAKLVLPQMST